MAFTKITDIIDPEILGDMILEKLPNNTILIPGVFTTTDFPIATKGTIWEIPYDELLGDFETYLSGTDLTPQKLGQDSYRMAVIRKAAVYSSDKIVPIAAFKDPMQFVSKKLAEQNIPLMYFKTQLRILEGAIPPANRKDGSGAIISASVIRTAKLKIGDQAANLESILMHSKQFGDLETEKTIIYQPKNMIYPLFGTQTTDVGAPPKPANMVATVAGLIIYVSDNLTALGTSPETYRTYLLGEKAMGHFWQQQLNIDLDRDVLAKQDIISPDLDFVMVLHGVDYTSTAYDDADISNTANYTLKWNQKQVGAVRLVTQ